MNLARGERFAMAINLNSDLNNLPCNSNRDMISSIPHGGWSMDGAVYRHRDKFRVYFSWEGKPYWVYRYTDGSPLYDRRQAERVLETIRAEIDKAKRDHVPFDPTKWAGRKPFEFGEAADLWVQLSDVCDEVRYERKRLVEKIFLPYWKDIDIRDISDMAVKQFLKHLKDQNYSAKYVKNIMSELRTMLLFHLKRKAPDFPVVRVQEARIRWINEQQQDTVFEFIPGQDRPIFDFMRYTGCRPNEACGLWREDIDWSNREIIFQRAMGRKAGMVKPRTKTGRVKVVPIIPELENALKPKHLYRFVFMSIRQGNLIPYSKRILERVWDLANKQATDKYGTPRINLYNGLKHSLGCQRINQGFTREAIKQLMGHTTDRASERYAQYSKASLADVMRGIKPCADFVQEKVEGETS